VDVEVVEVEVDADVDVDVVDVDVEVEVEVDVDVVEVEVEVEVDDDVVKVVDVVEVDVVVVCKSLPFLPSFDDVLVVKKSATFTSTKVASKDRLGSAILVVLVASTDEVVVRPATARPES
jgi:hypothetical protein